MQVTQTMATAQPLGNKFRHKAVTTTGGLTCVSSSEAAGVITPLLSGGTVGQTATFTIRIVTASGRQDDRTFYLKIQER